MVRKSYKKTKTKTRTTKNAFSSSSLAFTLKIFHQVNVAVEAILWGGNKDIKAVPLEIISPWVGGAEL